MTRLRDHIAFVRQGGHTKRFHTMQTILTDTVGHHSFNVFWLAHYLGTHLDQVERYTLGLAAMAHDLPEQDVGDMPAPAKREMGIKEEFHAFEQDMLNGMGLNFEQALSREGRRILKLCDALDGLFFCVNERMMGSKVIAPAFSNFLNYAAQVLEMDKPQEVELYEMAQELWTNAVL